MTLRDTTVHMLSHRHMHLRYNNKKYDRIITHICTLIWGLAWDVVEAEMSQKLSWRDLFVQIELGVDITSLGFK